MKSALIFVLVIVSTLLVCIAASQNLIEATRSIMEYLGHLAKSDFSQKMPRKVLKRNDEIGEMGRHAEVVSASLAALINTDPLTGLYNRRACRQFLVKWLEKCEKNRKNLITVALGDIDFFKKINDTYGHDCGDMVLVKVSEIFKRHMGEDGCVSRWGGEEFLLVFEEEQPRALERLEKMVQEIRTHEFVYNDQKFHVTLTIGVNGKMIGSDFDEVVNTADECLYKGKKAGRDRIVVADE